jgi:alkanesulfonate monooxygenase SsuD/methylene tetrahydromethanopterin reductase-like flavin-dependent oxidoreductase (luciferase family)
MIEAWISEHQAPSEYIMAKAAALTKTIMFGSAVRPLAYYHPFQVTLEANSIDQITNGRYILGAGFGFYPKNMEWRGLDFSKTREMMHASLEVVLQLWNADGPIDYDGPFWTGKNMELRIQPMQKPHPRIAVAVNTSNSTAELAGRRGFYLLTSDFAAPWKLKEFFEVFDEAAAKAGRPPSRKDVRACRVVYVSDSDEQARNELRDSYQSIIDWEIENTPHHQIERIPPGGTLEDITFDYLVDTENLFVGSTATVKGMLERFYDEVGGFGGLMLHAGRPYSTEEKRLRSMEMFMSEVAPHFANHDPDAEKGLEAAQ